MDKVGKAILMAAAKGPDIGAAKDGLSWFKEKDNYDEVSLERLRSICVVGLKKTGKEEWFESYRLAMLISAPHSFDQFMQYLEIDRRPQDRFYLPRREKLMPFVKALQKLSDGRLKEVFCSQPPRTGKTTLTAMFNAFMMGRNTEAPTLYCTYTDTVVETYYNGLMEILTDVDTYNYLQIFPEAGVCRTDAKAKIIDLNRRKHYPSFTGRPIGGSLNGSCDASGGLIIGDDLCSGIEEAMSPDRLRSLWAKVDNNLIPRGKENSCFLWIGTRWSVADPIGVRQELLTNSPQFKDYPWESINIPALNDRDQSNFDYKYDVGFSTYYYRQRRASFERSGDIASWNAQFMGQPIEREGTVFEPDGMNYYNGQLPGDPDRVFMVVDPAWGGGDFVAAPVCYQYGEEIYVPDVVYSNLDKSKTQPLVADMVLKHGVTRMYIEGTKTTSSYGEGVSKILKENHGYPINIKTSFKNAMGGAAIGKNKTERIYQCAPEIKERFVFLADGKRSKEYSQFMQNVFSFKIIGKNLHDDAPDSLQMALGYAFPAGRASSVVKSRGSLGI